jgi:hypothetical protein
MNSTKLDKVVLGDKFRALLKKNSETIHPAVKDQIKKLHYTIVSSNESENAKSNALTTLNRYFVKYGVGSLFNENGKRVGGRRTKRARRSARKTRRHSRRA